MNENELCKLIIENMNGITCNRWYTMIINTKDKKAVVGIYTNGRPTDTEIIKIDYEGLETV